MLLLLPLRLCEDPRELYCSGEQRKKEDTDSQHSPVAHTNTSIRLLTSSLFGPLETFHLRRIFPFNAVRSDLQPIQEHREAFIEGIQRRVDLREITEIRQQRTRFIRKVPH